MSQRVLFAYPRVRHGQGSVVPRVYQLSRILSERYGDFYDVEIVPLAHSRNTEAKDAFVEHAKGAVVIGLQKSLRYLETERLSKLKDTSAGLCMDQVDSTPLDDELETYHVHILASQAGSRRMQARLAKAGVSTSGVAHVTHHADIRATLQTRDEAAPFRIGYLGNPKRARTPGDASLLDIHTYQNQRQFIRALRRMGSYPMHYGVRRTTANSFASRPFTKGFNAAAMGANILVNRQTDDAEFYLGPDYPYLIDTHRDPEINAGVEYARETYGTAEWRRGLEIMEHVRHLCHPLHVASELRNAIETARALAG